MRILMILTAIVLLAIAGLAAYSHWWFPPDPLRRLSGPPPILSFELDHSSGFFIDHMGHLITLRDAVQNCRQIRVAGQGFAAAPAKVEALPARPELNLALLRVDAKAADVLTLVDVPDPVPQEVAAALRGPYKVVGFRDDETTLEDMARPTFIQVVPHGMIRAPDQNNYVLFQGRLPPSMSGGALVDGNGLVVGVYVGTTTLTAQSGVTQLEGDVIVAGEITQFLRSIDVRANVVDPAAQESVAEQHVAGAMAHVMCFHTGYPRFQFYIPNNDGASQRSAAVGSS